MPPGVRFSAIPEVKTSQQSSLSGSVEDPNEAWVTVSFPMTRNYRVFQGGRYPPELPEKPGTSGCSPPFICFAESLEMLANLAKSVRARA